MSLGTHMNLRSINSLSLETGSPMERVGIAPFYALLCIIMRVEVERKKENRDRD